MNFIKEFLRKRKQKQSQKAVSDYGDISVACIYHDHFIKTMDAIMILKQGKDVPTSHEVLSKESGVKTEVKGESITLNSSNNIFKESVLFAIDEQVKEYDSKRMIQGINPADAHILDCSNMVIELTIETKSTTLIDFIQIYKYLINYLDIITVKPHSGSLTYLISGSCRWFYVFKDRIIEDGILNSNIIAMKLVECIDSIIPQYGTKNGSMYFTALETNSYYINRYEKVKDRVQVLSKTNELDVKRYHLDSESIASMHCLYLVIDNAGYLASMNAYSACEFIIKVPDIDRYIIKLKYCFANLFISTLEELNLEDYVKNSMRDNIISTIKSIVPTEYTTSYDYEYNPYDGVDEIIEN